jgi:RimJ/RimL family protein N-acetyltransferase
MRFWHRPAITRLAVVEELMREQQAAMDQGLCRYWTLVWNGRTIGSIDLSLIQDGAAELGFVLRPDYWGKGLASEAIRAVIAYALSPPGLARLAAVVQTENRAAARVLEKNGFTFVEARAVLLADGQKKDCAFYLRMNPERFR